MRRFKDGTTIEPLNIVSVNQLSDLDLFQYLRKLDTNKKLSQNC